MALAMAPDLGAKDFVAMNLSELLKKTPDEIAAFGRRFYGVVCDGGMSHDTLNVEGGIYEISFVAQTSPENAQELDLDFIDTVLSYVHIAQQVIIEIPFDLELSAVSLLTMANNFQTSISLLPPTSTGENKTPSEEQWEMYSAQLCAYAKAWIEKPNCTIAVLPVVGYFQYLIQNAVSDFTPDGMSEDPYMQESFVQSMSVQRSDWLKVRLQAAIYEAFGGEEKLRSFAAEVCLGMQKRLKDDIVATSMSPPTP